MEEEVKNTEATTEEAPVEEAPVAAEPVAEEAKPAEEVVATPAAETTTPKKGSNKPVVIFLIVALLIIGGVVAAILLLNNKDKDNTENTTTTAAVQEKTIEISFSTDGGTDVEKMTIKEGEKISLPTTSKDGYEFKGWFLEDGKTEVTNDYEFKESTCLYAKWEELKAETKTMKITFDSNGGSKVSAQTYTCNDKGATIKAFPKKPTKDGYTFRVWEDKHGTPILEGALLTCENVTLYAAWDKNAETTPTVKYTCTEGELSGDKCIITKNATRGACAEGLYEDGNLCVKYSDHNQGTRSCPNVYIEGHDYQGTKVNAGTTFCLYAVYESITTQSACESTPNGLSRTAEKERYYGWYNGKCYKAKLQNYETTCDSGYKYYSSADIQNKWGKNDNGYCFKTTEKPYTCDNGYELKDTNKCVKTVNATKTE